MNSPFLRIFVEIGPVALWRRCLKCEKFTADEHTDRQTDGRQTKCDRELIELSAKMSLKLDNLKLSVS